jgi:hypothetical protein
MVEDKQVTAVWFLIKELSDKIAFTPGSELALWHAQLYERALDMEREQIDKFNDFLEKEKQLEISDLKTIERIQWYYNTYFNETYGGNNE